MPDTKTHHPAPQPEPVMPSAYTADAFAVEAEAHRLEAEARRVSGGWLFNGGIAPDMPDRTMLRHLLAATQVLAEQIATMQRVIKQQLRDVSDGDAEDEDTPDTAADGGREPRSDTQGTS
jgi:hypothetical protein